MTHRMLVSALLLATALVVAPRTVSACGAPICQPTQVALGDSVVIPANAPGLALQLGTNGTGEVPTPTVHLYEQTAEGDWVEQAVELDGALVIPSVGLAPDTTYRLEVEDSCGDEPIVDAVMIETVGERALPDSLGTTIASAPVSGTVPVSTVAGSCNDEVDATYIDVSVDLDPTAADWIPLLGWTTYVDGEVYRPIGTIAPWNPITLPADYVVDPRGSWRGPAVDRIYTRCGDLSEGAYDEGVDEGVHEVVFQAFLPGTDIVVTTASISIELSCTPPGPGTDCSEEGSSEEDGCFDERPPSSALLCSAGVAPTDGRPFLALVAMALGLAFLRRR